MKDMPGVRLAAPAQRQRLTFKTFENTEADQAIFWLTTTIPSLRVFAVDFSVVPDRSIVHSQGRICSHLCFSFSSPLRMFGNALCLPAQLIRQFSSRHCEGEYLPQLNNFRNDFFML
jgi:hypothetical protein